MKQIRNLFFWTCLLTLTIISFQFPALAIDASGGLTGTVYDKGTSEVLIGANVVIQGTSIGASTDINGEYTLRNIPAGTHTIVVSYIGYSKITIDIDIPENETVEKDFYLQANTLEGNEITVTAQAQGQKQAINQQLSATGVTNVVSKDRIQAIPEANAAEAVGRLPGISIKRSSGEGDEIVVRGVQPKFNLVTVNGIRMPSTNENSSSVGLAGISQYLVDGIDVRKSLRAEDDGDVVGGKVDLILAKAPKGFHGDAIVEGMYNGLTNDVGSYRSSVHLSNRFLDNKLGVIGQINFERADRTNHALTAGFNRDTRSSGNQGVFLTNGNFQKNVITRDRFGATVLLDYKLPKGIIQVNSIYNNFTEDRWERNAVFNVSSGAIGLSKDMRVVDGNNHTLVNGISLETEVFGGAKLDVGAAATSGFREGFTKAMGFNYDASVAEPIAPQFTQDTYGKTAYDIIPHMQDTAENYDISRLYQEDRDFSENEYTFQANLKIPISLSNQFSGAVKFGGKVRLKNRDYDYGYDGDTGGIYGGDVDINKHMINANPEINWPWGSWSSRPPSETALPAYPLYGDGEEEILKDRVVLDGFAQQKYVEQIVDRADEANWANLDQWYQTQASDLANDYSGDEQLYAGYVMTDIKWGEKVSFNVGVRYEHETTEYKGYGVYAQASTDDILDTLKTRERTNDYFLPSATLKFNFADWGDVRLAYSQSLARPEYYAFIPHYSADLRKSFTSAAGNTQLEPSLSHNYDLILSFYSNEIGLFTVSGFYKKIDNFFYQANFEVIDPEVDNQMHDYNFTVPKGQYINVWRNLDRTSHIQGIELSWQTHLWYLPSPFDGIVIGANYSRIESEAYYYTPTKESRSTGPNPWEVEEVRIDSFVTRPLIDQPNNLYNVSLGYDYKGFSIRFAYNFQGKTLSYKSNYPETDGYTHDYSRLDLSVRQKLPVDRLSVQLLMSNITREADKSYTFKEKYNNSEQYYGMTGSLGLRYEF